MENTTRKQLEGLNKPIYNLSGAHSLLLNDSNKIGTNYGLCGFNWEAFEYDSYIIVTGNRNYPKNAITINYYDSGDTFDYYKELKDEYKITSWDDLNNLKQDLLNSLIIETNK